MGIITISQIHGSFADSRVRVLSPQPCSQSLWAMFRVTGFRGCRKPNTALPCLQAEILCSTGALPVSDLSGYSLQLANFAVTHNATFLQPAGPWRTTPSMCPHLSSRKENIPRGQDPARGGFRANTALASRAHEMPVAADRHTLEISSSNDSATVRNAPTRTPLRMPPCAALLWLSNSSDVATMCVVKSSGVVEPANSRRPGTELIGAAENRYHPPQVQGPSGKSRLY
jgi:hypothetical protein